MVSSAAKVLGSYELLEAVLTNINITARELFVLQSVGKTWRAVIQRSETLQKKMFLLQDGDAVCPKGRCLLDVPKYRLSSICFLPASKVVDRAVLIRRGKNPDTWAPGKGPTSRHPVRINIMSDQDRNMVSITIDAKLDIRSSSREMLLTQPPVQAVVLYDKERHDKQYCTIYNRTGITIGDILDTQLKVEETEAYGSRDRSQTAPHVWRTAIALPPHLGSRISGVDEDGGILGFERELSA